MLNRSPQLNKFDLPAFNLSGGFPTKAVYSDLVSSQRADPNTTYVVQRMIDGKPGAIGWGYLPTAKDQEYSINWYISPTSVAHVEIWNEQEAGNILNSIHIDESATVATFTQMPGYVPAKNSTPATPGYTIVGGVAKVSKGWWN
jgi:hypothetical protein